MNTKILLLALVVVALSSCSTAYKTGQTPDDVYFSPAKEQAEEYVNVEDRQDRYQGERYNSNNNSRYNNSPYNNSYDDFYSYRNDRMLRMSIGNRMRLSAFDDYYWNDGYNSWKYNNYGYTVNNPWNSYYYWNNFYNPYTRFNMYNPYYSNGFYGNYGGGNVIIVNPKTSLSSSIPITRPRAFNPGLYNSNSYSNNNLYLDRNAPVSRPGAASSNNRYNNSNRSNNSGIGNTMRKIFAPENDGYYNNNNSRSESRSNRSEVYTPPARTYEAPSSRSYTPSSSSSSSSSSSGSSSGGGGGVSRPTRGGN